MAADELDDFERKLVALSARRYRRAFYRWGHLLGWLVLPITGLMLEPAMQPYSEWLLTAVFLLMFHWYFVVSTRVIGKLQSRPATAPNPPMQRTGDGGSL